MSGACRPCQWTKAPSVPTAFCGPGVTYARFTEDTELQLGLTQAGSRWNLDYIPAQAVSWGARHKPGFGSRLCCSPAVWSWVSLGDFVLAPEMGKESSCFVASGVGSRGEPMWRNRLGEGCPVNSKQKSSLYSVQFSHVRLFATPWTVAWQDSLSITKSQSLLKLTCIESVTPPNHLILCHPLLPLQSFPGSGSFPMSQFFTSGGPSIGASALASVLPINTQG